MATIMFDMVPFDVGGGYAARDVCRTCACFSHIASAYYKVDSQIGMACTNTTGTTGLIRLDM